jgi:hypothetical protein
VAEDVIHEEEDAVVEVSAEELLVVEEAVLPAAEGEVSDAVEEVLVVEGVEVVAADVSKSTSLVCPLFKYTRSRPRIL